MGLMDRVRGWFARGREEELEEAEEERRDPSLRREEEKLFPPGAQSGYTPGGSERGFEE